MEKKLLIAFFLISGFACFSQATIKLMTYNLLNFNNYTTYCTSANNSHVAKAGYLNTIVTNQQPDILAACEVGTNTSASYTTNYILGNALNINGETKWLAASPTGSYLINGLFYDKNKFQLVSQPVVTTDVRDINIYKLKYLDSEELLYLNVVISHLKAGDTPEDAADRAAMVQELMDYLHNLGNNENYVIVGDFNVYTDSEQAFQKYINPTYPNLAFFDPVNQLGDWNSNYSYRNYHTQSTHDDSNSDCHSYGGMDDRFDFILISSSVKDGTAGIEYKADSYWAVGQDGYRYNNSINSPTNSTLPANVISALYNMSDHLPVVAEFYMGDQNSVASLSSDPMFYANIVNPVEGELKYQLKTTFSKEISVCVYSVSGKKLFETAIESVNGNIYTHDISYLAAGMYILNFSGEGINQSFRIVKGE